MVAEGMIMVYLIARGHRHGRKVPLRSYSQPVRPAVNPVLFTITVIVNGAILIPASSPLLLKPMFHELYVRSMAARRCLFRGLAPEESPENLVNHYHIGIPLL